MYEIILHSILAKKENKKEEKEDPTIQPQTHNHTRTTQNDEQDVNRVAVYAFDMLPILFNNRGDIRYFEGPLHSYTSQL